MSIVHLWLPFSGREPIQMRGQDNVYGRTAPCSGIPVFFFFLMGVVAVVAGERVFPLYVASLTERISARLLLVPAACALFAGSMLCGAWLILLSAFVFGASEALFVFRFLVHSAERTELLRSMPAVCAAVPVFFFISFLSLKDSARLTKAFDAAAASSKREAIVSFILQCAALGALLSCILFLRGI